jgi:hypothetical protein
MLAMEVAMSSQPTRSRSEVAVTYERSLGEHRWRLLVRLPRRVLLAAFAIDGHGARPTLSEGLAGMAALAAGRHSASRLVHEVVAAIYTERDGDDPVAELDSPEALLDAVLRSCAAAGAVLADQVPAGEAAAYRRWLLHIAAAVRRATRIGLSGNPITPSELRLLDALDRALAR